MAALPRPLYLKTPQPYDPAKLGHPHMADEYRRIADLNPTWDEEMIEELIRWGGPPPLHSIGRERERGPCVEWNCTFVDHRGRLVPNVWMGKGWMAARYAGHPAVEKRR
jgi:hypothetical protein